MITGMLTLNKEINLEMFLKKKFFRIIYPLIFFFLIAFVLGIYSNFLIAFWYCWMVIGVYLAIPIINIFIKNASERLLEYYLCLFIFAAVIYNISHLVNIRIALDLDFFIGPASYLILGYYLFRKNFNLSPNKIVLISFFIFVFISIYKIYNGDYLYINNHPPMFSLLNLTLPQIIQASSIFIFFKYLYNSSKGILNIVRIILENRYINNIILSISRSSYGIYLFHMLLLEKYVNPIFEDIHMTGINTSISIFLLSFILLIFSWITILILGKIPYINKLSGYY